jgi:hypothetical protein
MSKSNRELEEENQKLRKQMNQYKKKEYFEEYHTNQQSKPQPKPKKKNDDGLILTTIKTPYTLGKSLFKNGLF